MKPNPDHLEKAIHETLRSLPNRKAPSGFEARVLAEIARRDALPWWHHSWAYWPSPVRWAFLVVAAGLCAAMIASCVAFFHDRSIGIVGRVLARPSESLAAIGTAVRATLGAGSELFGLIPRVWLYGGVATITLLYATVFLVGAAAYRTLWQSR